MANLLQFLIPKDKKFFPLLEKSSANLVAVSKVLYELLTTASLEKRRELTREIERLEHVGDNITHEIVHELSLTFITPFDREDIHALTSALDDIVDYIYGSSKRIETYKVEVISTEIIKLAELIEKAAIELNGAIIALKSMNNVNKIKEASVKIHSIENHADDIFDMAVARLFDEEKDAIKIIKMKEILSVLETATDKCEDAANVIESIIVKNA
jgi:uncharacterized protein